ncbi:MAG: hypothetical protein ABI666_01120 [Ferruginibacter sp.]
MKKAIIALLLLPGFYNAMAQDERDIKEEKKGGFKKENLFTGGGIELSLSNSTFVVGASPVLGYSINKWIDIGIGLNFTYYSNRHVVYELFTANNLPTGQYIFSDDKLRQTVLGPLAFARVYPIKFLFIQAQGEQNFITQKLIFANGAPTQRENLAATSFLVGAGYCNGREETGSLFYYVSIMVDVAKNKNSPYVEQLASGRINVLPIIRAGLQVPLFQGRRYR